MQGYPGQTGHSEEFWKKWPTGGGNGKSVQLLQREPHEQYEKAKRYNRWKITIIIIAVLVMVAVVVWTPNKGLGGRSGAWSPAPHREDTVQTGCAYYTVDGDH